MCNLIASLEFRSLSRGASAPGRTDTSRCQVHLHSLPGEECGWDWMPPSQRSSGPRWLTLKHIIGLANNSLDCAGIPSREHFSDVSKSRNLGICNIVSVRTAKVVPNSFFRALQSWKMDNLAEKIDVKTGSWSDFDQGGSWSKCRLLFS